MFTAEREILRGRMSQENVEVVREFMRLFEAGDRSAWRTYFDPDVVWDTSASTMPQAGIYHGHDGMERFFREWLGAWSDYEIEAREFIDAGGSVVIAFHQSGTGRTSGVRTERDFFAVYDVNDSKVVRYRQYESRIEALEAAGLSDWAMSQENVEAVREAFEAFNRGDLDAALQRMHPDIEWETVGTFPDAGTYRGREEVAGFWRTWRDSFRGFTLHLGDCVPVGDRHVLATFHVSGEGAGSGVGVESPAVFQLGEIRDGQVVWVRMFLTESEALEAARMRE